MMIITIVGLGVIGGSFAQAIKLKTDATVYGIDTNIETIEKALSNQMIDQGSVDGKKLLKESDLVIFSIYPRSIIPFINQHRNDFKPGSILNDATGVKQVIIQDILSALPSHIDFIFGHPMAGREKRGVDFADYRVFEGANYIITPIESNSRKNINLIRDLMSTIGFNSIKEVSPKEHDELIGFTSQLPHALAVALINSDQDDRETGRFIGDSYRELTRIANINEELWSELFLENRDNLLQSINNFESELSKIKKSIVENDIDTLKELFIKSSNRREKL